MEFLRMRKQWKLKATLTYTVCICVWNWRKSQTLASIFFSISVPENCEVNSRYFTIKKIAQFRPAAEAALALNKIYKIEETGIVMQSSGGQQHHQLMTLKIPDRALIEQIKRHRDNLENKLNTIKIPGYFDNWSSTE